MFEINDILCYLDEVPGWGREEGGELSLFPFQFILKILSKGNITSTEWNIFLGFI